MTALSELVGAYQDAFNRHDLAGIDALHSFSAGTGELLAMFTRWFTLVPDVKCEIRAQAEAGPVALVEMTLAGTDTEGNPVNRGVVMVVEAADGLIVAERHYTD